MWKKGCVGRDIKVKIKYWKYLWWQLNRLDNHGSPRRHNVEIRPCVAKITVVIAY